MPTTITKMSTPDVRRQSCRYGSNYIIDVAKVVAEALDRNFVTALVFLAVTRANVSAITAAEVAHQRPEGADLPPDAQRLPVSVYAIARDLRLPYETARRHVGKLKAAGRCAPVGDGLIVPTDVFRRAEAREASQWVERFARRLVNDVAQYGISFPGSGSPPAADLTAKISRLSTEYFIDCVCLMTRTMNVDIVAALVLWTIANANTDDIRKDPALAGAFAGLDEVPPDDLRRPVSVYFVSRYLMLPYETTRRTCLRLVEQGLIWRGEDGGLVVPTDTIARPETAAGFAAFADLTVDFISRLAGIGLVAADPVLRRGGEPGAHASNPAYARA